MPAAFPASMHFNSHAIFLARFLIVCNPSPSCSASPGTLPWTTSQYVEETIVKSVKNDIGQEVALCAEVYLNSDKVKELEIENVEEQLKKDISKETKELASYKHITKIEIRKTEFIKTTTKKIKR